jgi:hypothetical protein
LKGSIQVRWWEPSLPRYGILWGTRVYASSTRRVSEKGVHNRRRGNLPCLVQEVVLYLRQEISALLVLAVVTEVTERVEMRKVNGFVALFAQFGLFPCAIRPLADAALDLKTSTNRQHPEQGRVDSNLTTMSTRAITSNGMGAKYS